VPQDTKKATVDYMWFMPATDPTNQDEATGFYNCEKTWETMLKRNTSVRALGF